MRQNDAFSTPGFGNSFISVSFFSDLRVASFFYMEDKHIQPNNSDLHLTIYHYDRHSTIN